MEVQKPSRDAAGDRSDLAPKLGFALGLLFLFRFDRQLLFCGFPRALFRSYLRILFCKLFVFQVADFREYFDYLIFQRRVFIQQLDLALLPGD